MSLVDSPISRITVRRVDPYGIPMSRKGALIALPTTWEQLLQIACKELIGEEGPTLPTTRIYLFECPRTRLDAHGLGIGGQLYPHTWHLVRDRDILDVEFVNYTGPSKPPKSDVAGAPTSTATTTTTSPATVTTTSVTIEPSQPTESTSIRDTEMTDASTTATTISSMETSITPATTTDTTTSTSSSISTEPATTTSTAPVSATTEAAPATTPATSTTSAATTTTTTTTTTTEPVAIHSIEVSVRDADSSLEPTFFKVHRRKPLNKLMRAYCTHVGVDIKDVRFEYQGIILQPTHTCDILEMQEGAEIVMIHNTK